MKAVLSRPLGLSSASAPPPTGRAQAAPNPPPGFAPADASTTAAAEQTQAACAMEEKKLCSIPSDSTMQAVGAAPETMPAAMAVGACPAEAPLTTHASEPVPTRVGSAAALQVLKPNSSALNMQRNTSTQDYKVAKAALQKGLAAAAGKHGNGIKKAGAAGSRSRGGRVGGGGKENLPGVLGILEEEMGDLGKTGLQEEHPQEADSMGTDDNAMAPGNGRCDVKPQVLATSRLNAAVPQTGLQQLQGAPRTRVSRSRASGMR